MHKSLALAALLLPFSGYGITKKERIAELKEAQYQKMLELRSIMDALNRSRQLMDANASMYEEFLQGSIQRKKEQLDALAEKSGHKKIDKESIRADLDDSNKKICEDFAEAITSKKEFKHSLFHELFDLEATAPMSVQSLERSKGFYPDKLIAVNGVVEIGLMMFVVAKYHQCIQELITISQALIDLEA